MTPLPVTPAEAGVSGQKVTVGLHEIPAFAGMTVRGQAAITT